MAAEFEVYKDKVGEDRWRLQAGMIVSCEVAHEDADRFLNSGERTNDFLRKQPGFSAPRSTGRCRPTPASAS